MNTCPLCKTKITCLNDFRDNQSVKEYKISGMCQNCQDGVFGAPSDEAEKSARIVGRCPNCGDHYNNLQDNFGGVCSQKCSEEFIRSLM